MQKVRTVSRVRQKHLREMVSMDSSSSDVRMFEQTPPFLTFSIERILAKDFGPNKFLDAAKPQTRAGDRLLFGGGLENDLCSFLRSIEGHSSGGLLRPRDEWSPCSPRSDEFSKLSPSPRGGGLSPVSSCSSCEDDTKPKSMSLEYRRTKRQLSFGDPEDTDPVKSDVKPLRETIFCDHSLPTIRSSLSPHSEGESPFYQKPKRTRVDLLKSPCVVGNEGGFERLHGGPKDDIEGFDMTPRLADESYEATDSKRSLKHLKRFDTTVDRSNITTTRTCSISILGNELKRRSFGDISSIEDGPNCPSKCSLKLSKAFDSAVDRDNVATTRTCSVSSLRNELTRLSDINSIEDGLNGSNCKSPPLHKSAQVKLQPKPRRSVDSGRPAVRRRDSSDSDGSSADRCSPDDSARTVDSVSRSPASISGGEVSPRKDQPGCAIGKTREVLPEKEWPVWVYCSRYSARPSSGPRSRRQTKRSSGGGDLPSSSTSAAEEKRCRTAFSASQLSRLRAEFASSAYLGEKRRISLSRDLGLSEAQVKIWFQNRRAKVKKASGERNELAIRLMEHGLYNHSTSS